MRTLCVGDIHGANKALKQCLERANFNIDTDTLISLGDVVDGWPESRECIETLLRIKNRIQVLGNHDKWFYEWAREPRELLWKSQGGEATFNSYVPQSHIDFFRDSYAIYMDDETSQLFVHGGLDTKLSIEEQKLETLIWDRSLANKAWMTAKHQKDYKYTEYKEIFIGHTPTSTFGEDKVPLKVCNVWMMDTGAGWTGGKLSIMDVDTKEYWQSDVVDTLYPGVKAR